MANRNYRQEGNLNERIAAIRENNVRLENRHREIELDKKRAVETGSSIQPSQIKVTISCCENRPIRNGAYDNGTYRGKTNQAYRPRGGGGGGPLGYNLSKSLSRLPYDMSYNSQPQFQPGRQRAGGGSGANGRGFHARRGGAVNNFKSDYVRYVEIDRCSGRGGKQQRYPQNHNNRNYNGPRNGQQQTITPSKSLPSLDPIVLRQNSRHFNNNNNNNNQGRGGSNFCPQNLPPRFRRNSHKAPLYNGSGGGGGAPKLQPPPPPPFPPPSPSQPTPSQKLTSNYTPKERNHTPWVRGMVIKSKNSNCRVAAVSTQCDQVPKSVSDSDSPFINPDEDDNDGYIDDNPLDDLDQFTLKIDMDGGFIVHDATICDPILSKPISSWIDEVKSEPNESDTESKDLVQEPKTSSQPEDEVPKSPEKDRLDIDGFIFSNSSLTTSGVSTMSSLDCRIVGDDFHVQRIQRSYSADQLVKVTKTHRSGNERNRTAAFTPLLTSDIQNIGE
ncbi:hypothetical protein Aperf_G00000058579 [Anoplocephala perfoliata]